MTARDDAVWPAVDAVRRSIMQANRRRDTGPELAVRRALHAAGMRYRVDYPIRAGAGRPVRPDIVFTRQFVAVFIDGCFWHGCPRHGTQPATRSDFWAAKIVVNRERDQRHDAALKLDGWTVVRIWEHEDAVDAAARVIDVVRRRATELPETRS